MTRHRSTLRLAFAGIAWTLVVASACAPVDTKNARTSPTEADADQAPETPPSGLGLAPLPALGPSPIFGEQVGTQCANCPPEWYSGASPLGMRYLRISGLDPVGVNMGDLTSKLNTIWSLNMVPLVIIMGIHADFEDNPATYPQLAANAAAVSAAFPDKPIVFEIWNEPNHAPFWDHPNANNYADYAIQTVRALKAQINQAHSPHYVIGPALSIGQPSILQFFDAVRARQPSLVAELDAVSIHGYVKGDTAGAEPPEHLIQDVTKLRQRIGNKPLFISEYGWNQDLPQMSAARKADYSARLLLLGTALGLSGTILYDLRDQPPGKGGAGLLDANGRARPAFNRVGMVLNQLRGTTFIRHANQAGAHVMTFQAGDGSFRIAAWRESGTGTVQIKGRGKNKKSMAGVGSTPKVIALPAGFF